MSFHAPEHQEITRIQTTSQKRFILIFLSLSRIGYLDYLFNSYYDIIIGLGKPELTLGEIKTSVKGIQTLQVWSQNQETP